MMNADSAALSTRVGYRDLQYQRDAEFRVEADRNRVEITILLDLDVSAVGGFFTGECLLGMTQAQAIEFVHLLVEAFGRSREPLEDWDRVGSVGYSWSDQGEPPGAEHSIQVMCRHGQIRVVISPDRRAVSGDYIATLGSEVGEKLADALSRVLSFLGRR
jgi:hypothetical protein